jgi:ubiquitin-conjugating enzyme E2 O
LQDSKNLSLLSCFPHENWEVGDWCLLQGIDCNNDKLRDFIGAPTCQIKGKTEKVHQKQKLGQNLPDIAVIAKKNTKVDVLWQDGSYSMGLDPKLLISISLIDPHDFWPGQIVIEKEMCDDDTPLSIHKYGIVKSVNAMDRTVKVEWRNSNVALDHSTETGLHQTEEIFSAYELTEHPDYSYSIGDAVFRLHKGDLINHSEEEVCGDTDDNQKELINHLHNNLPSFIGIVAGLKDGYVEVKWTSGITEKVAPYEICGVVKFENSSSVMPNTATGTELMDEGMSELDYQFQEQIGKDKASVEVPNENVQKKLYRSSACSLPQAATGLFTHIRTFLFDSFRTYLLGGYNHLSEDGEEIQTEDVPESHKMLSSDTIVTGIRTTIATNVGAIVDEVEEEKDHAPHGKMLPEQFRQFDIVNDCSDHHFADGTGNRPASSQIKQIWLRKVQQEWGILKRDLPETIYVRVYEERIDLLRAAIVGPQGTPYHDLLFFFDFVLPPEYPNEPPTVYYISGGLRINPNLYESGKVCLSLLNTWTGSGSEVWNPKSSTILQVLLSLQALVLNEKPYFNEAGYDLQIGTPEAEKNSMSYNENAFLVSCRSLLYLIRRPPKHFEELVKEHINGRGKHILLACKAYMEGSPVGSAFEVVKVKNQESITGSSMGFKIMIRKIFPKLVEAFFAMGTDCSQLSDQDD